MNTKDADTIKEMETKGLIRLIEKAREQKAKAERIEYEALLELAERNVI